MPDSHSEPQGSMTAPYPTGREAAADDGGPGRATASSAEPTSGRDLTFEDSLPFTDETATIARRAMSDHLHEHGAPQVAIENALLVVHELICNGIDHGEPCENHTLKVAWRITAGLITIEVTDCGTPAGTCAPAGGPDGSRAADAWRDKVLEPVDMGSLRGRGLHLVAAMSRSWDVHTGPDGTTVTALVNLDA